MLREICAKSLLCELIMLPPNRATTSCALAATNVLSLYAELRSLDDLSFEVVLHDLDVGETALTRRELGLLLNVYPVRGSCSYA
jgi:hypothetical protein